MSTVAALSVVAKADPVARARALGPALTAAADEIERSQEIPEPLLSQLHEARLFRILLPRSVGGDQVEPWTYLRTIEEISRFDGSVGWNTFVGNSSDQLGTKAERFKCSANGYLLTKPAEAQRAFRTGSGRIEQS